MSNYLIVCAGKTTYETVENWLSNADDASADLLTVEASAPSRCYYLADGGKQDSSEDGGVYKGHAIDHDLKQICYSGATAAPNVNWPVHGCYIRIQREGRDILVGNDLFAQLPMLYFYEKGVVAISDSVFVLTEIRRKLGLPNRVNRAAALSRSWIHGMAHQPLGTGTLIEGVSLCPPGSKLRIDLSSLEPRMKLERVRVSDIFVADIENYVETIIESSRNTASLIAALTQISNAHAIVSLSGGIDSRICLAAALDNTGGKKAYFSTNPGAGTDFPVAADLSRRYGFDFGNPPVEDGKSRDPLSGWFISCAGLFDPLHTLRSVPKGVKFTIGGHGAETYKGMYGWRPMSILTPEKLGYASAVIPGIEKMQRDVFSRIMRFFYPYNKTGLRKIQTNVSDAAKQECAQGLREVAVALDDPMASEWHYLCYGNAIQSGRPNTASLLHVGPLLQRDLVALSRSPLNEYPAPANGMPSIGTDLLIALNPALACLPFDDPRKNLDSAYVYARAKYIGRVKNVSPYAVLGDPQTLLTDTPKMFSKLAISRGFHGNLDQKTVKRFVEAGYETIPDDLKPAYHLPKQLVDNELPEHISRLSWYCTAAGKIMAFMLAD